MRVPRAVGLTAAALTAVLGLPLPAASAATGTLYVDNTAGSNCSDSGVGSQAQPFCTISAAAAVVVAGQTVHVAGGDYPEHVDVTHSGTPDAPITFTGTLVDYDYPFLSGKTGDSGPALTISGAHDVVLRGFVPSAGVLVENSSHISLERNVADSKGTRPVLSLAGPSSDVTISRNRLDSAGVGGISVGAGVTGTTISGNTVNYSYGTGIAVDGATGTTITNNTLMDGCGPGIALTGASSGFNLYNNIVAGHGTTDYDNKACAAGAASTEILVSTDSQAGSHADYNLVWPGKTGLAYSWAGKAYQNPDLLKGDTGQGAHDLLADPKIGTVWDSTLLDCNLINGIPDKSTCSPALDSADATAPGVPATDAAGNPAVDDPFVDNPGAGYLDRGAFELQDSLQNNASLKLDYGQAPYGTVVTFTATDTSRWANTLTYTYDFGDGTSQTTAATTVTHTYSAACDCTPKVTVTAQGGKQSATATSAIKVTVPGPLVAKLSATAYLPSGTNPLDHIEPLSVRASAGATVAPWPVRNYTFDFGDGTAPSTQEWSTADHAYASPGDYKVTVKLTDNQGRTDSTSQTFHAVYTPTTYTAVTPFRMLDTRKTSWPLAGGQSRSLYVSDGYPGTDKPLTSGSPSAVVLNVTATRVTNDTYLTVWPDGRPRPGSSNLNVKAGQTVANLVTVPVGSDGSIQIYNNSGRADVIVDFVGFYQPNAGDRFTATGPSRLLDTRPKDGTPNTQLGSGEVRSVTVAGTANVPANASAVVLNLTATEPTAFGYLTAYPHGGSTPTVSNLNFEPGQTVANQAIVPIGTDGKIDIFNHAGSTQVIADVFGYYSPDSKGVFVPIVPTRLADTRPSRTTLGGGAVLPVQVGGTPGVPTVATAAVLNVTATRPTTGGYLTVWPDGADRPGTSNLNFGPGQTVPNHVITPLGNGKADIFNHSGNTDVIADLFGYFTAG